MSINNIQIQIWNDIALNAKADFRAGKLPKKGVIKCPRYFILQYFSENNFALLCQSKNETQYIFGANASL